MAVTKYESYYKQIKESVDEIRENYDYKIHQMRLYIGI